jgi:hypothetical protein
MFDVDGDGCITTNVYLILLLGIEDCYEEVRQQRIIRITPKHGKLNG